MTEVTAFWAGVLGISFLVVGIITYRRDLQVSSHDASDAFGLTALGPVFVAASLATFAGEHYTAAAVLAKLVPKWMPARLFIAYFVGTAHLAAASSFVARRYIRWSALGLALMFALFVLLMDLPGAVTHPAIRISWSLAARQSTFAMGALALFATVTTGNQPHRAKTLATIARIWTAAVLIFYGVENILYPQFTPGVPDITPTQACPAAEVDRIRNWNTAGHIWHRDVRREVRQSRGRGMWIADDAPHRCTLCSTVGHRAWCYATDYRDQLRFRHAAVRRHSVHDKPSDLRNSKRHSRSARWFSE